MSKINVGEYWFSVTNDENADQEFTWLYLITARATFKGRQCVLAIQCDMKTGKPSKPNNEFPLIFWFDELTGNALPGMMEGFNQKLLYKSRRVNGKVWLL